MVTDYKLIKPGNALISPFNITITELGESQPVKLSHDNQRAVDVLVSGSRVYEIPAHETYRRFFGGSTVTYVTDGEKKVIVDTGFENFRDGSPLNHKCNEEILRNFLRMGGLDFNDIDKVFLTHNHKDHADNAYLFKYYNNRAEIILAESVKEGDEIIKGLTVIDTPGHTPDHKSLQFRLLSKIVVIAGDAVIDEAYFRMGHVYYGNPYTDGQITQAKRSMGKIGEIADYIIPGHGTLFAKNGVGPELGLEERCGHPN